MVEHSFALSIMFSYLILIGFITVFIALTGQTIFGSTFPTNPITSQTFNFVNTCAEGDLVCTISFYAGIFLTDVVTLFNIVGYVWNIMIFMMTSPTVWWLGLIVFLPAGIVFAVMLALILIAIAHAVATAIPF
jgi:hypothetical protein